jgi:hypothetical protein
MDLYLSFSSSSKIAGMELYDSFFVLSKIGLSYT